MATGDRGGGTVRASAPAPISENNARMQPRKPPPPAKPAPKEQPGRSPQGPAPVQPQPLDPPHPVLQAAGFQGPVSDFNHRVEQIVPAYQQAHAGQIPAPGLVLDIARSPVDPTDYAKLFEPSFLDPGLARLSGAVSKQAVPTTVRPDGIVVTHTVLTIPLHLQGPVGQPLPETPKQLAADHPWVPVEAGFLPIANFGGVLGAFQHLLDMGVGNENGQVTVGGKTLGEYQRELNQGEFTGIPNATQLRAIQQAQATPEFAHAQSVSAAIQTVKSAQDELQARFPAYFKDLPASGNLNDDWVRAIHRFQGSATYYQAATTQLAKDNHFSSSAEFVTAWKRKNAAVKSNALLSNAAQATPLAFYGNGQSVANFVTGGKPSTWGYYNVPTVALHTIGGVARTVFAGAGILAAGAKSDMAAADAFFHAVAPRLVGQKGMTLEQAKDHAMEVALQHPSWLRAVFPELPASKDEPGWLKATDDISNFVIDIWLGNKLVIGGSAVKIGDDAALLSNRYARGSTVWAHNVMKAKGLDGVAEASKVIQGGEKLNKAVAESIRNGDMSLAEYRRHVSDLYNHGRTELADGTTIATAGQEREYVLSSLHQKELPNPKLPAGKNVAKPLDSYDETVRQAGQTGTSNATGMFSPLEELFAHAAPSRARIMGPKAPENLYNMVMTHFHDRDLAYRMRNDLVLMRAEDDVPGIQKMMHGLNERYAAENPMKKGQPAPFGSEGPLVESQSLTYLNMLGGRTPNADTVMQGLENEAHKWNARFNTAARYHRQIIIGTPPLGESLFYKHTFADTMRRFVGGGGLRFDLTRYEKSLQADVAEVFRRNPELMRDHGFAKAEATMGEAQYISGSHPVSVDKFDTGAHFGDAKRMDAAGAYLRTLVTDPAYNAVRLSSRNNLEPLFQHVWKTPFYQNKIAADERYIQAAAELKTTLRGDQLTKALSTVKQTLAQDYAEKLWREYQAIEQAGAKVGQPDTLEHLQQVAIENVGAKTDSALGKAVKDLGLDFPVKDPVLKAKGFDNVMQRWTGVLMTMNKVNRRVMFDKIFYQSYGEMLKAGWQQEDALGAATAIARRTTVYHMLDFSNMLQVEQNLRWVSYFATKHRLYWTWIAQQFAHKPLLAAAVLDVGDHLTRGNLNFSLHGMRLSVPVARLFWVNQTEYPETSPIVEAAARLPGEIINKPSFGGFLSDFAQQTSTQGNVISRDDQAIGDMIKYVKAISGGHVGYGQAIDGMSQTQRTAFNREFHNYALSYRAAHNGNYPSEQDVVKATLLRSFAQEAWRANLFLPVLPASGQNSEIVELHKQFDKITDPAKRIAFLEKHPKLGDSFGASGDQALWLHNAPLFDAFKKATAEKDAAMNRMREQLDAGVSFTVLSRQIKQVSKNYREALFAIRQQDARTWPGNATYPKGHVADYGKVEVPGPWGIQLDGDPLASNAFLHEAFPGISRPELTKHTITQQIVDWRAQSDAIRNLGWKKTGFQDEQHAKDFLSSVQDKIAVFNSLPKNPTSKMTSAYFTRYFQPYAKMRDQLSALRKSTSAADKDRVDSLARAIQARYDHPVEVTDPVTGKKVTFPSPVSYGFTQLDPDQYRSALAGAVSGQWEHLANYEKNLLGIKTPTDVAEGWAAYQKTVSDYERGPSNTPLVKSQRLGLAKQVDKVYPGFYKDFLFSQQPKIVRLETTSLYRTMPADTKAGFAQYVGGPAKELAKSIAANGSSTYYLRWWRNYVRTEVTPWLNDPAQKALKEEIARYGPNFLNTLPSVS